MTSDWSAWLNLALRWIHVFAAIMWVGQTYFFTWMDGRFTELAAHQGKESVEDGLWLVHSGGFYVVRRQRVPQQLSQTLHWFKWEAATTWLSGFALLVVVYYAGGLLADAKYAEGASVAIGIGFIIAGWVAYDALWASFFERREQAGVVVSFLLIVGAAYGLAQIFGGRTAYIHVGAMFGTIMTANVWMRIIPAQRRMVKALADGTPPDLTLGARAKTRSKHNTFLVVPVVFIMISNHYPTISYGSRSGWLVLSTLVLAGWGAATFLRRA